MGLSSAALRRVVLPSLCALILAGLVEGWVQLRFHPDFWAKTTWLMHDQFRGEPFDRVELYQRLRHLENTAPEIISVGDSSGFFSLQSEIVNKYTDGHRFLSLNTGANHAYDGYAGIAEYMLHHNNSIKYVVLYLYPQLLPEEGVFAQADLGKILWDDFVGLKSWVTPPSAGLSAEAKFRLLEGVNYDPDGPLVNHVPSLQLWSTVDYDKGWLPEFDIRFNRLGEKIYFVPDTRTAWYDRLGLTDPSSLNAYLSWFDGMVQSYGAKLVIAFAPFPRSAVPPSDPNRDAAEKALVRFQQEHPDVKFLFPLITAWGSEKFGIWNHIAREYSWMSSERMGRGLHQLLTAPDSIKPFTAEPVSVPQRAITSTPTGPADPALLKPALALFGYTSTGDDAYKKLISPRTLASLEKAESFRIDMDRTRGRMAMLKAQGIDLNLDLSSMVARPVKVTGMNSCGVGDDAQWVQLSGAMVFTYRSRTYNTREAVSWPETSGIDVPLVMEDGALKFAGYCPEPSLEAQRAAQQAASR